MSEETALVPKPKLSEVMASELGMDSTEFRNVIKHTVMPSASVTNEHITAFLVLANQFGMNPFSDQVHAFPHKGGVKLIIGYDGFIQVANRNPQFEGFELHEETNDKGDLLRVGCQIFRADRKHHPIIWEYMAECKRGTDPWKNFPNRMLRNKAVMQGVRAAFGTASLMDKDEALDMGYDQKKGDYIDHDEKESGEDLETRLEEAIEKRTNQRTENAPEYATKYEAPNLETNEEEIEDENLVGTIVENVTKEVETKDGTVPFEVGPTPKEIVINKIDSFVKKTELEKYLKAGEKLKWPAQFNTEDVKDLVNIGKQRLETFDV